jgi:hypothetical protein
MEKTEICCGFTAPMGYWVDVIVAAACFGCGHALPTKSTTVETQMPRGSYQQNLTSPTLPGFGEAFQPRTPPIVHGVPKLLFTDEEVAEMYGVSVSTVRNRYNYSSRWYDPKFPVPRSTDGSGKGRKAAVRWHWEDLFRYADGLPSVSSGIPIRGLKQPATRDPSDQPFRI